MAEYWFKRTSSGIVEGPCVPAQLRTLAVKGIITAESLISPDQERWYPAGKVKGLFETASAGSPAAAGAPLPYAQAGSDAAFGPGSGVSTPPPPAHAILLPQAPPAYPARVEQPGEASPLLVWPSAMLAPLLLLWSLVASWESGAQPYAGIGPRMVAFWSGVGSLVAVFVLVGVWWKNALAYRAGVVIGPLGGGFIVLSSLAAAGDLTPLAWTATLCVAGLSVLTPILWTRPGAKRYFGLCCPQCNSVHIGAESFAFSERRCLNCGTFFKEDGTVLRIGAAAPGLAPVALGGATGMAPPPATSRPIAPGGVAPVVGAGAAVSPDARVSVAAAQPPGTLAYATSVYRAPAGTPGRERDVTWFLVVSCILLAFGALVLGLAFASAYQEASSPSYTGGAASPGLEVAFTLLNCFTSVAALGLWIYWLVWIYQVHKEMRNYTGYAYHISPGKALGFCFIPFFNLFWDVYMPYELAKGVQGYLRVRRDAVSPSAVLTFQILAIVPGSCVLGLGLLFIALGMRSIQGGLNALWAQARQDLLEYEGPPKV